ncbi:MAG: polyprenyl synthetase family protein [Candidatus Moranbacteria bacterium]|nr:polyprenyl synthetase family protein [Candidatus Moranbacteria bacterium]
MDAIELLKSYKDKVDPLLGDYFSLKIKESEKMDPLAKQALKMLEDFTLSGGKRVRPALVYYGYLAAGGRDGEAIIKASMSIELTHVFLLIHDDIIDKDAKRHGVDTIHERYKKISKRHFPKKDAEHFGNSMAMLVGDMAAAMGNEIIFRSDFPAKIILDALDKLQEIVYKIVPGEMKDVYLEMRGNATEKEILDMYEGKTSSYSFEGPLHLGAALAGKKGKDLADKFSRYSMAVGKAFQIRDDILGVFGEEKKIGKPVGSDIIEGKQTILVARALANGNKRQIAGIRKLLGKKDLTKSDLEDFRNLIKETGALAYSEKLMEKLVSESLEALKGIGFKNQEARTFLEGIARYMVERQK